MIIYTYQKSKKRKKPNAKERELAAEWDAILNKYKPKKMIKQTASVYKPTKPFVRETPKYPSLKSDGGSCTKPVHGKVYTGTKMIGIGTLHKSNAVPIFTEEDAKSQASMRR